MRWADGHRGPIQPEPWAGRDATFASEPSRVREWSTLETGSATMSFSTIGPAAYVVAFGGGLVSFLSPCVLPLVPAYLSVINGLDATQLAEPTRARSLGIARDTGLFITGFAVVFIALGTSASGVGRVLFRNQLLLTRLSGITLLAMGLFLLGSLVLRTPWLYQEARFHPDLGRFGRAAPLIAGLAFGFGWTPCIGPVLGSILTIAATQHRVGAGATLLAAYSLGLGVPFLASGLLFSRLTGTFAWVKRHVRLVVVGSGASLVLFGVLLVFNKLLWVTSALQDLLRAVGLDRLINLG